MIEVSGLVLLRIPNQFNKLQLCIAGMFLCIQSMNKLGGREVKTPALKSEDCRFKSSFRSSCYSLQKGDLSWILSASAIKLLQFAVVL